jgi:HK97 family phage prohead protease
VDFRAVGTGSKKKLVGMPIVYGKESEDMGFIEVIQRGAARNALLTSDARALYGHNSDSLLPLGRMSAGTLRAIETERGVEIEIDPPDSQFCRDLALAIERGDIQDMSFAFSVAHDKWERRNGKDYRTITEIAELMDFSIVSYPAYSDTTVALRAMKQNKNNNFGVNKMKPNEKLARLYRQIRTLNDGNLSSDESRQLFDLQGEFDSIAAQGADGVTYRNDGSRAVDEWMTHTVNGSPDNLPGGFGGGNLQGDSTTYRSLGEQLLDVRSASMPGGQVNDKLLEIRATGLSEGIAIDGGFLLQQDFSTELLASSRNKTGKLAS